MNMGTTLPAQKFFKDDVSGILKPIIYCCTYGNIADKAISINMLMAEKLFKCKANRRTMQIGVFFNQVLDQLSDNPVIKDFDVMFNPDYKVDVLKIMVDACKRKSFSIVWPGKYEDGKLFYAEEGYLDFKIFRVEEYDVTCIV